MEESDSEDREGRDEISLLAEELIQLLVKGSMVVPNSKPTLICTVWTEKLYNPESFRAQMKSIWKTRKKFEIQMVGQNLFLIVFDLEEDLETIMEGRPWHFRKSIILFDRLIQAVERDQIRLNSSPFWIKIDSYLPEFDKKELLHAIGVTFGGVLRFEINKVCCRLRITLDVRKPLRREEVEKLNDSTVQECKNTNPEKKTSWKRIKPVATVIQTKAENSTRKRKSPEEDLARSDKEDFDVDGTKRLKHDDFEGYEKAFSEHNPHMVFLIETKLDKQRMEKVRRRCGFTNGIDIKAEGKDEEEWRFTGSYGSPYVNNRSATWNLLKKLGQDRSHP
ncbi:hypothetical protein Godav_000473, partial [Gossypium davidsonii]|nr:hypothetical protein [Gossypium davidsonii]